MQIKLSSPEGNTLVALGIARRLLKQVDRKADADKLMKQVMDARSAKEARKLINKVTVGAIEFIDYDDEIEIYS